MVGILFFTSIALWLPIIFPEDLTGSKRSFNGDIHSIPHILTKRIINISEAVMGRSMNTEERQGLANFMTSRLVGVSESIMGWVEKSVDDLPKLSSFGRSGMYEKGVFARLTISPRNMV